LNFTKAKLKSFFITLILSVAGALVFELISFPLPWILGPLVVLLVTRYFWKGASLYWPLPVRHTGLLILGYFLGASFTVETAQEMVQHFPVMLLMTLLTIGFCILLSFIVAHFSKIEFESVLIGSMPGGLSQMVLLGEELKMSQLFIGAHLGCSMNISNLNKNWISHLARGFT
jgi:membrane AbrB-like protein